MEVEESTTIATAIMSVAITDLMITIEATLADIQIDYQVSLDVLILIKWLLAADLLIVRRYLSGSTFK